MADRGRPRTETEVETQADVDVDVVVIGAGFAGLSLLHRARLAGFTVRGFEAAPGVGGTWYWNRYPGARCDVPSLEYSFGFDEALEQEWAWTERYATQPEILRYLEHVADRFDLRRSITFGARVTSAVLDAGGSTWTVATDRGGQVRCRFVVAATGCLSSPHIPAIPGLGSFAGVTVHTGRWPTDGVDVTGKRVAVIGTGSSAVQAVPLLAEQAAELTVFQRTATYAVPAWNEPLKPELRAAVKARYRELRAANRASFTGFGALDALLASLGTATPGTATPAPPRPTAELSEDEIEERLEEHWRRGGLAFLGALPELLFDREVNELVAEFVRGKIRRTVRDPATAELLCPRQVLGCKRLCVDSGYYETYNRPNVHLVDVSAHGIDEVTATGIRANGREHDVDVIVFATGFDAVTGALAKIDVQGVGGRTLRDAWRDGPRTYLGLGVPGFPNLFLVTGPGSPSVLTNMVTSIEQDVEWIVRCLEHLRAHGHVRIEAGEQATEAWVRHVAGVAELTLFPSCNSWYIGANVDGKPRVFLALPGFGPYAERCAEVAAHGYEGFVLDGDLDGEPGREPAARTA